MESVLKFDTLEDLDKLSLHYFSANEDFKAGVRWVLGLEDYNDAEMEKHFQKHRFLAKDYKFQNFSPMYILNGPGFQSIVEECREVGANLRLDPAGVTAEHIIEAIRNNGYLMGSTPDYIRDEVTKALADTSRVSLYFDTTKLKVRGYYR